MKIDPRIKAVITDIIFLVSFFYVFDRLGHQNTIALIFQDICNFNMSGIFSLALLVIFPTVLLHMWIIGENPLLILCPFYIIVVWIVEFFLILIETLLYTIDELLGIPQFIWLVLGLVIASLTTVKTYTVTVQDGRGRKEKFDVTVDK